MKINLFPKDKKGASFSGWSEAILVGILFILAIGIVVEGMNSKYGTSKDPSFGLDLQNNANQSLNDFKSYQESIQTATNTGQASFASVFGLTLSTSYDVIKTSMGVFWSFISGGWILKAVMMMQLPLVLGIVFQLIYLLSIGYILIKILFKINP